MAEASVTLLYATIGQNHGLDSAENSQDSLSEEVSQNNEEDTLRESSYNALGLGRVPVVNMGKQGQLIQWRDVRIRSGGLIEANEAVSVKQSKGWVAVNDDEEYVKLTPTTADATTAVLCVRLKSLALLLPPAGPKRPTSLAPSRVSSSASAPAKKVSSASSSTPSGIPTEVMMQEAKKLSNMMGSTLASWTKQAKATVTELAATSSSSLLSQEETIAGSYRVRTVKKLATGGFSEVFLVRLADAPQTSYALKKCKAQTADQLAMLRREVAAHAAVAHDPNVLRLIAHDQIVFETNKYMVRYLFPLCEGGSWHDRVFNASGLVPEREALAVFVGAGNGLKALHGARLMHRDVKPHNVLLTGSGTPLLIDLGSTSASPIRIDSKGVLIDVQEEAAAMSSAPYRAPELYEPRLGMEIGPSVDAWALGCSLFAVTFGKGYSPYEDPTQGVMKLAILNGSTPRFPDSQGRDVAYSDELRRLIVDLTKHEPEERCTVEVAVKRAQALMGSSKKP